MMLLEVHRLGRSAVTVFTESVEAFDWARFLYPVEALEASYTYYRAILIDSMTEKIVIPSTKFPE